jgi:hypothetical protein
MLLYEMFAVGIAVVLPLLQRVSIRRLRPTAQPASCSP